MSYKKKKNIFFSCLSYSNGLSRHIHRLHASCLSDIENQVLLSFILEPAASGKWADPRPGQVVQNLSWYTSASKWNHNSYFSEALCFSSEPLDPKFRLKITSSICHETSVGSSSALIFSDRPHLNLQVKLLKLRFHKLRFFFCVAFIDFAPCFSRHYYCYCRLLCATFCAASCPCGFQELIPQLSFVSGWISWESDECWVRWLQLRNFVQGCSKWQTDDSLAYICRSSSTLNFSPFLLILLWFSIHGSMIVPCMYFFLNLVEACAEELAATVDFKPPPKSPKILLASHTDQRHLVKSINWNPGVPFLQN